VSNCFGQLLLILSEATIFVILILRQLSAGPQRMTVARRSANTGVSRPTAPGARASNRVHDVDRDDDKRDGSWLAVYPRIIVRLSVLR